ncbi:transglycosylase domain-containing protein [Streptomyces luomodiensis]|uniref:Transglycosylase domain-containing protein n=2 Tax=Streptomyces luomodiensis TaxID=3026192 RepID=A0ABY9VGB3_9ACTN|nr:transglycosylase domain-containing protein [Streptomyces sp. SCA4-21]WNF01741.1 transglycosylase domain-containing protein [Streptomyces sp. SCA4-21]
MGKHRKHRSRPPSRSRGRRLRRWAAAHVRLDYPRAGRRGVRRWLPSWRQIALFFLFCLGSLTGLLSYLYLQTDIPKNLNDFATQQDNVYYWADGTEMARTGPVNRQEVPLDRVPEKVQWAVLAAENASFYSDSGVSPSGLMRAVTRMVTGGETQGGSTITQQYVKNAYLNQRQTFSRKLTEMFMAIKLDDRMSKREILQRYLNTSWFGRGSYGIQRASYAYYGKDVSELNASEGALLASLLKGAGTFDPTLSAKNHKRAVERWKWVLDRMVDIGRLSKAERARYTTFPEPQPEPKPVGLTGQVGYLVETAKAYVSSHTDVSDADFDLGGYQIHTTFEKSKVDALTKAVNETRGKLDPERRPEDRNVRIGAGSVAPDGAIRALYGGPGYLKQGFNDANASNVPAGTSFTPFVYAAALRDGVLLERNGARTPVTPSTLYDGDNKVAVHTPEGPYWDRSGKIVRATNDGDVSYGQVTLRQAIVQSINTPMMQLGMDVGLDEVRRASIDAGLLPSSFGERVPAFSLGTATPSSIRMASAYGTFAAGGTHNPPYSVSGLTHGGEKVELRKDRAKRAFSAEVAAEVDDALRGAVQSPSGAAHGAAVAGEEVAGKGGTAQDGTSAWFVGYTKELSTAVSLSRLDPKTQELMPLEGLGGEGAADSGDTYPLDIWKSYMTDRTAE